MALTDAQIDDFNRFENEIWFSELAAAKERLKQLSVADLRVLAKHYWGRHCGAEEIPKAELVEELAVDIVDDER